MFPVKREPSEMFDVGNDSQGMRLTDINQESDTFNTNMSDNWHYKSLSEETLTVAYIKNEVTSNTLDYNNSNSKGNKEIHRQHGQHLIDVNDINTEKTEACSDYTSGDVTEDEHGKMHVKEESQHNYTKERDIPHASGTSQNYMKEDEEHNKMKVKEALQHHHIKEHDMNHMTDISQFYMVGDVQHGMMHVKEESQHRHIKVLRPSGPNYRKNVEWIPYVFCKEYCSECQTNSVMGQKFGTITFCHL